MSPETHDAELASLANALAALAPSPGRLDRDQVLYRAGQASAGRRGRLWPSATALLALLLVAVGLSERVRPAPQRVQCTVYQRVEPPASPAEPIVDRPSIAQDAVPLASEEPERQAAPLSYLRLQQLVFAWGVDALPNPPAAAQSRQHDGFLSAPPDVLSRSRWLRMQTP